MSQQQTEQKNLRNTILHGDVLAKLKELPAESIDMCMTSPPYWALRDYGVEGQLGLEPTFTEYITKLVSVFDEVKRTLKPAGTCWVNLGDTFNGSKVGNTNNKQKDGVNDMALAKEASADIPDKCLLMIPERFAIEMINHGWILRSKIVWHKPNAMPSSAKDRFTVDWEYLFMFAKSKKYYFETQYQPYAPDSLRLSKLGNGEGKHAEGQHAGFGPKATEAYKEKLRNLPKFGGNKAEGYGNPTYSGKEWKPNMGGGDSSFMGHSGNFKADGTPISNNPLGAIKRCVWTIPTQPYKDAHFATYPEKLVETPIKAGCPEFVCAKCGKACSSLGIVLVSDTNTNGNNQLQTMRKENTGFREDTQRQTSSLLQQEVFNQMVGKSEAKPDCEFEGLHSVMEGGQVFSGAPSGDGAEIRSPSPENGCCAPYQRSKDGQQTGEPNSSDRTRAQHTIETETEDSNMLSAMQGNPPHKSPEPNACPNCGSTERKHGLVLDCFFGSGTTGLVALKLGRDFVGVELNAKYIEIANKRLAPLLAQTRLT